VSTSSCSLWLRDMPHPVFERRLEGDQWHASWAPVLQRREALRQQAKLNAALEMLPTSDRDILVAGAVAYWCEGAKSKAWRRTEEVTFINSDVHLLRLYLRFLDLVGVRGERLRFRVSIHETADVEAAIRFWADIAGVPTDRFSRTTIKRHRPLTKRRNTGDTYHGCLIIRVRQGADLYRRIEGWVKGLTLGSEPSARRHSSCGGREVGY